LGCLALDLNYLRTFQMLSRTSYCHLILLELIEESNLLGLFDLIDQPSGSIVVTQLRVLEEQRLIVKTDYYRACHFRITQEGSRYLAKLRRPLNQQPDFALTCASIFA